MTCAVAYTGLEFLSKRLGCRGGPLKRSCCAVLFVACEL